MQQSTVADLNRILELRIPVNLKGLKFSTILEKGDDFKRVYYLQSVSAHQGSNDFISDIEVTIKEFRIATTKIANVDKNNMSSIQKASEDNIGKAKTQEVNMSTWSDRPANMSGLDRKPTVYIHNDIKQQLSNNMSTWSDRPNNMSPSR